LNEGKGRDAAGFVVGPDSAEGRFDKRVVDTGDEVFGSFGVDDQHPYNIARARRLTKIAMESNMAKPTGGPWSG